MKQSSNPKTPSPSNPVVPRSSSLSRHPWPGCARRSSQSPNTRSRLSSAPPHHFQPSEIRTEIVQLTSSPNSHMSGGKGGSTSYEYGTTPGLPTDRLATALLNDVFAPYWRAQALSSTPAACITTVYRDHSKPQRICWKLRDGTASQGLRIPFGTLLAYLPISQRKVDDTRKCAPRQRLWFLWKTRFMQAAAAPEAIWLWMSRLTFTNTSKHKSLYTRAGRLSSSMIGSSSLC